MLLFVLPNVLDCVNVFCAPRVPDQRSYHLCKSDEPDQCYGVYLTDFSAVSMYQIHMTSVLVVCVYQIYLISVFVVCTRCTCLHLAAVLGRPQLCRLLLEKGADPNVKDSASNTALILAAASGSAETVKVIIAAGGLFSKVNDQGVSALHVACKQGSVEVVDVLLQQHGVEINKASSLVDEIPLFCAAYCGHVKVAQLLLEKGADVNKTITSQLTPLHMAARSSNSDMIDLLAKNGANLNSLAWVDKRIRQKLRFDLRDSEFRKGSLLNFAVDSTRDGSSVKVLLSLGADVEAVTQREPCTPLMIAAGKCKTDVARMLLGAGAKTDRPDLEEKALSPLLVAIQGYYPGAGNPWKPRF